MKANNYRVMRNRGFALWNEVIYDQNSGQDSDVINPAEVTATVQDTDTAGITVTPVIMTFSKVGNGSFTVVLNIAPSSPDIS